MFARTGAVCILSILSTVASARAASVVIGAAMDNTVYAEDSTRSNGAGEFLFAGMNGLAQARRALIRFDIAAAVPAGATIDSVTLTLHMSQTSLFAGPQTVSLHRVLASWGEGTSDAPGNEGSGTSATPGDATWSFRFYATSFWAAPGGDLAADASASQVVDTIASYTWTSDGMRDDVQGWLDAPGANSGWILIGGETVAQTAKRFDSRQRSLTADRPQLTIDYSEAPTAVRAPLTPGAHRLTAIPNPFNPTTAIRFELTSAQAVRVSVFDVRGRTIRTLVAGALPAGGHSVVWAGDTDDGARAGSGVYFVRLQAGSGPALVQKLVLVK